MDKSGALGWQSQEQRLLVRFVLCPPVGLLVPRSLLFQLERCRAQAQGQLPIWVCDLVWYPY